MLLCDVSVNPDRFGHRFHRGHSANLHVKRSNRVPYQMVPKIVLILKLVVPISFTLIKGGQLKAFYFLIDLVSSVPHRSSWLGLVNLVGVVFASNLFLINSKNHDNLYQGHCYPIKTSFKI